MSKSATKTTQQDIAIVGYSCRLPGAQNVTEFWNLLRDGRCSVTEIPADRFAAERFLHPKRGTPGKSLTFAAGVIDEIFGFDPAFFGISPREAVQMDPQQRLLLELTWEALEHAGVVPSTLAGTETAVVIGGSSNDHYIKFVLDASSIDAQMMTGNAGSILSNRISYQFDLRGPSFTLDTACSSSLVALHEACEAIRSGRVETAIVGGVNALLAPFPFVGFSRAFMLSATGRCRAFAAEGDGYVRSEGAAVLIIQSMEAARKQRRHIHATIVASGVNSDGHTAGLSMPSRDSQSKLLEDIYLERGIDPKQLAFIEAHGTGTPVGDPAEAFALGTVLGKRRTTPLLIGSVKTNIGHLEAASGLAGLLKALLALKHGQIPASLHFVTPNPNIAFEELNLRVAAKEHQIVRNGSAPLAGINSFGFGGTNSHVVLRAPEEIPTDASGLNSAPLFISARSSDALRALAARYRSDLEGASLEKVQAVANAAAWSREWMEARAVMPASDSTTLCGLLKDLEYSLVSPNLLTAVAKARSGSVAFVFSGNGSQYAGMGRDAFAMNATFRKTFEEVDGLFDGLAGWSLVEALHSDTLAEQLKRASVAQPLLFATQVSLVEALSALGITPCATLGHSVGEIAAAWASGAFGLEDAVRIVHARSVLQEPTRGKGGMAAVVVPSEQAAITLDEAEFKGVEIAAINTPRSITVSGPTDRLAAFLRHAKAKRWPYRRLDIEYPYHTELVAPLKEQLVEALSSLTLHATRVPFISTVTGAVLDGVHLDSEYWWRNVRNPVQFNAAVRAAAALAPGVLLEIGPAPVLTTYVAEIGHDIESPASALPSLERKATPAQDPVAYAALRAIAHGAMPDKKAMFGKPVLPRFELPQYPWQHKPYLVETSPENIRLLARPTHALLGATLRSDSTVYFNHIDIQTFPWLSDHRVESAIVVPGAALLDMVLGAAREIIGDDLIELRSCAITKPILLTDDGSRETMARVSPEEQIADILSRPRGTNSEWTHHARAQFRRGVREEIAAPEPVQGALRRVETDDVYALMANFQLNYGPSFKRVQSVDLIGPNTSLVTFFPTPAPHPSLLLNPCVLDAAFHGALWTIFPDADRRPENSTAVPTNVDRLTLFQPHADIRSGRVTVHRKSSRSILADIDLFAEDGSAVAALRGGRFAIVPLMKAERAAIRYRTIAVPLSEQGPRVSLARQPTISARSVRLDAASLKGRNEIERVARAIAHQGLYGKLGAAPFRLEAIADGPHKHIISNLLSLLKQGGLADCVDGNWRLSKLLPKAQDNRIAQLSLKYPALSAEVTFLAYMMEKAGQWLLSGPDRPLSAALLDALKFGTSLQETKRDALLQALDRYVEAWPKGRGIRVLVFGTGDTVFLRSILKLISPAKGTVTLTDPVPEGIERTLSYPEFQGLVSVSVRPWHQIETGHHGRFDVVTSIDPFFGLSDRRPVATSLRSCLEAGGSVVLLDSHLTALSCLVEAASSTADASGATAALVDLHASALLSEAGFVEAKTIPVGAPNWPLADLIFARAPEPSATASSELEAEPKVLVLNTPECSSSFQSRLAATLTKCGAHATSSDVAGLASLADAEKKNVVIVVPPYQASKELNPTEWIVSRCILLRSVFEALGQSKARLWIVLPGSLRSAVGMVGGQPETAALGGFVRVAFNEYASLDIHLIDALLAPATAAHVIASEILKPHLDREIIIDAEQRFGVRALRDAAPKVTATKVQTIRLDVSSQGSLDRLVWRGVPRVPPRTGEIEIEVEATGLNFRDVMWAQGLLPPEALEDGFSGPTLGMECAGRVVRIGPDVSGFAPGDRVAAFASGAFARHVSVPSYAAVKLPATLTPIQATTIPVAFLTAYYSLIHLARLKRGETVLVHGAAGGVGLAAIQIAKWRGAKVVATAGTPEKRALLKQLGADVFDSRNRGFANDIEAKFGGVDVVLNSLAGESMERSLACLKPFGRFIELGKRDFYSNTRLGLRPFRQNLSYFGVDADQLLTRQKSLAQSVFREVFDLIKRSKLKPLPYRVFEAEDATAAFRLMQQAGNIGKVVVRAPTHGTASPVERQLRINPHATYLVVGGLGGFGLALAKRLVLRGARHIALVGRRGVADDAAKEAIELLRSAGAEVQVAALDASDSKAVRAFLAVVNTKRAPLRGVFHAAMTLDDALIRNLTADRISTVLQSKIEVARVLDQETRRLALDWFVLFSSATTFVGNPGQANYVAANAYLEELAHQRRRAKLPALAIAWGAISDVGYLTRNSATRELLGRKLGRHSLTSDEALNELEQLLSADTTQAVAVIARMDWRNLTKELPIVASPTFETLRAKEDDVAEQASGAGLADELRMLPPETARRRVIEILRREIGRILRVSPEQVDPMKPLTDIGLDSLMGMELRMALEEQFGIEVPLLSVSSANSLNDLGGQIQQKLKSAGPDIGEQPHPDAPTQVIRAESKQ